MGAEGGAATKWAGSGWRDMDSRDVFENETSSDGVVRPWSWDLRFPRLKKDAKTPMRFPSELRRRSAPFLEVAAVSAVSTAWRDPLAVGSCVCSTDSTGVACAILSERSSGI